MTITALEKQKKSKRRWNIYADGDFFCGLYDDTILKYGLHVNEELSAEKLEEIKSFDEYIFAKEVAYNYLSYRIRTISEITKKLRETKISDVSIARVLELLEKQNLTSDSEFAIALIQEKIRLKPAGKKILRQKLFEKGVPKAISEEALENIMTDEKELELASGLFKKYYRRIVGLDFNEQRKKTYDYLTRKGFDYNTINEVINTELKEQN